MAQQNARDDRDERDVRDASGGRGDDGPAQDQMQRNPVKDPDDWKTGDEPMTGPQQSYLSTLAQEAGEEIDPNLSKAEASKKIDELQDRTGRGDGGR